MSRADLDAPINGGMHASIFCKVWGEAGGGDTGRIALANYAFELGKQAALAAQAPVQGEPLASDVEDAARLDWLEKEISESAMVRLLPADQSLFV